MCTNLMIERVVQQILREYHDSVVEVKGGHRYLGVGRKIKPMTTKLAAESAGMKIGDFYKRIDPNQQEHRPFLESWVCNLMDGMDMASLDALEHALGRMVFKLPDELPNAETISRESIKIGKEFGDVMGVVSKCTNPKSEHGEGLSPNERKHISIELRELITQACVTLAVVEEE